MNISIQKITPHDDAVICHIIKTVGAEFGAIGDGFGPSDAEVLHMSEHYCASMRSQYWVARIDGVVVGGCGIAPFNHSTDTCELRKLFLLPEGRGCGLGRQLVQQCLSFAQTQGFTQCYLDTLKSMHAAISLYESLGFEHLAQPLTGTPHCGCDVWMLKKINK
ncbi:GNAT family N-acetyltransferase [Plesiomonas shigelloides]|uniref:GNAT family N-acetyltransferase n=1 Tax=Plesiomonas shigelloides TaxID=703 RepID=UPI00243034A1|nr:GNAT family N-acetyltransferase [Plesiomonas shigelloides]